MAILHILRVSKILSVFAVPFFVFLTNTTSLYAQSVVSHGGGGIETETRTTVRPLSTTNNSNNVLFSAQAALVPSDLTHFETFELRGNYTAAGVGLRGRTWGIITLSNIPIGASIHKAYLYWSFLDNGLLVSEQNLTLNGIPILGTEIGNGEDTCWSRTYSRAFRADVTPLIAGNGTYMLAGIANQSSLLAQGASLVVVYADENGVLRTVIIQDGNGVINNGNIHLATTIDGFIASDTGDGVSAKTTFIVGDGQNFTDTIAVTAGLGTFTLENSLNGSDGGLWDTDTYNVSPYVADGDTSATARISRGTDCLNWVAQIFSVTSGTSAPKFSNVLFLPGLEASRLYRPQILQGQDEDQLWEPTRNEDVEQLYLSSTTGKSLNSSIYTRDIIDESPQIVNGYNIYKSFIAFMNDEIVGGGIIDAWKAIPYDWRLDYDDILTSGRKTGDNISYLEATSTPYIIQELRRLVETSRTGKVTIIAHSNGGLLAKALIEKLKEENNPLLEKIDKLILVAVPQLGTPKAIEGLLHGDEAQIGALDFGFLLDEEHGRELGENMQSAYNLYGDTINSALELRNFLLGDPQTGNPRIEPAPNDDESPNVLKQQFLNRAAENHDTMLDSWTPPASMEVIQIAGWGLKTIKGIEYSCNFLTCSSLSTLDREMLMTHEGDGTVVLPSAVQMNGADRFYVNIRDHNNEIITGLRKNRDHMNILEIDSLQKFIKNIISGNQDLEDDIYENEPTLKNSDKSIDFRLHSPVDIHLYDSQGNHAGLVQNPISGSNLKAYEARIPNSYYKEFGETKYIGVGSEDTYNIELQGLDFGTFTLEIKESLGNEVLGKKVFEDIPTSPQMLASMTIQTVDTSLALSIDIDSDGNTDAILTGNKNNDLTVSLKILENIIGQLDIHKGLKQDIVEKLMQAQKELAKGKNEKTIEKLDKIIKKLESEIEKNLSTNGDDDDGEEDKHKQKVSTEDARVIIEIVEKLKANVVE